MGVIGLSIWGVNLKFQAVKENKPQGNIEFVDARSEKDRTRSSDEVASAPGQNRFVLLLAPDLENPNGHADYAVDIFRSGTSGPKITSVDGLKRQKDGSFTLGLSGKVFPPGVYRVEFYGVNGAHREPLDTLSFKIAAP
jgi:hypothetical protein